MIKHYAYIFLINGLVILILMINERFEIVSEALKSNQLEFNVI